MADTDDAELCKFLHRGFFCDDPWATGPGVKTPYTGFQLVYIIGVLVLSTFTFKFTAEVFYRKGFKMPFDTQRKIFVLCCGICVMLAIRAIDPMGWRLLINETIIGLSYDICTSMVYSVVFIVVNDWVIVVFGLSARRAYLPKVTIFMRSMHVLAWTSYNVLSVLQANLNDMYLWRGIKLYVGAGIVAIMLVLMLYFGLDIFFFLRRNERKMMASTNSTRELKPRRPKSEDGLHSPALTPGGTPISTPPGTPRGSRSNSKSRASLIRSQTERTKTKSKVNRIFRLVMLSAVLSLVTMIVQISIATTVLSDKFERDPYRGDIPDSGGFVIAEGAFDIFQALSCAITIYFFRPKGEGEAANQQQSRANRPRMSRARTATRKGSAAAGGARSNRSGSRAVRDRVRDKKETTLPLTSLKRGNSFVKYIGDKSENDVPDVSHTGDTGDLSGTESSADTQV